MLPGFTLRMGPSSISPSGRVEMFSARELTL